MAPFPPREYWFLEHVKKLVLPVLAQCIFISLHCG